MGTYGYAAPEYMATGKMPHLSLLSWWVISESEINFQINLSYKKMHM